MSTQAPIVFRQATKVYRDFFLRQKVKALDSFDLSVGQGEIVGLLGPNGSGKSTAIRLLTGLALPSGGSVRLGGKDPRWPGARGVLGYLPEENANYPFLSARRLVRFHGRLAGLSRAEAAKRADELIDRVGLTKAANRASGTYSKGMSRRLGLAQCLVGKPSVLVLDEPTSGLDPVATEMVRELLQELRRQGVTVLLSSHLLAEIEDVCDRVVVLASGRVIREGSTSELLALAGIHQFRVRADAAVDVEKARAALRAAGIDITEDGQPGMTLSQFYRDVVREPEQ